MFDLILELCYQVLKFNNFLEQLRENDRQLRKVNRDVERDRTKLEREEKKIEADIKKAAKAGNKELNGIISNLTYLPNINFNLYSLKNRSI